MSNINYPLNTNLIIYVGHSPAIEYAFTVDYLLSKLPNKIIEISSKESFGLQMQIDGDGLNWIVRYYSYFVNTSILCLPEYKGSLRTCLYKITQQINIQENNHIILRHTNL